jgi:hypothetical protein
MWPRNRGEFITVNYALDVKHEMTTGTGFVMNLKVTLIRPFKS